MEGSISLLQVTKHIMKGTPTAITEFIESLNPKLMWALAKKHADPQTRPQTLQQAFKHGRRGVLEEYWRLNPSRDPAQYGSQALSTISTNNESEIK